MLFGKKIPLALIGPSMANMVPSLTNLVISTIKAKWLKETPISLYK